MISDKETRDNNLKSEKTIIQLFYYYFLFAS